MLNRINTPEDIIRKIDNINEEKLSDILKKTFSNGIQNSAFVGEPANLELLKAIIEK